MDEHSGAGREAAELAEAALLALSGRAHPAFDRVPAPEVEERARSGDPAARGALWVAAHAAVWPRRVRSAVAGDRGAIPLADGSRLARADAERVLAAKEEARVFAPLRDALADVEARERPAALDDELHERAPAEPTSDAVPPTTLEELDAVLERLREPGHVAREMLGSLGRCPVETEAALERALDLGDDAGAFSDAAARHLWGPVQAALGAHAKRPLHRVAVPRTFAGLALVAGTAPCRVGVAPTLRAARFSELLRGAGRGLVAAAVPSIDDEDAQALADVGEALALALVVPWGFPVDKRRGERACRILRARFVLEAELCAVLARVRLVDGAEPEAAAEALLERTGLAPRGVLGWLGRAPLPGGPRPRGALADLVDRSVGRLRAAEIAFALRDRGDEAWPLLPAFGEALQEARLLRNLLETLQIEPSPGPALVDWMLEMV